MLPLQNVSSVIVEILLFCGTDTGDQSKDTKLACHVAASTGAEDRQKSNCFYRAALINCCDCRELQMNLLAGAQREVTPGDGALLSVHCFQGTDMPVS